MPAQKIRVMVCSDCHEVVQKTGSVYFEKKTKQTKPTKNATTSNILNKFKEMRLLERSQKCKAIPVPRKMIRHVIIFIFALEQKNQQTLML